MFTFDAQTVGRPLTLQCSVTAVKGITSSVDFIWKIYGGPELTRTEEVNSTFTSPDSDGYLASYTIPQLSTIDDGRMYLCEVVINSSPPVMTTGSVTLDVTVPTPTVSIAPSGPIQGAMVGSPQDIQCTVSTVSGVELSSVMMSWMGPGGDTIRNDSRVTISPTSGSGNNYTSRLQLTYLAEGDIGNYICMAMILDTTASGSIIATDIVGE